MKRKKLLITSSEGLTLVEVLLSLTILGIVLMGTMKFFSQAYTFTNMNEKKTAAVNVARNALMHIEKENFIEVRDKFQDESESLKIFICKNSEGKTIYKNFWNGESPESDCSPIQVNNIEYNVTINLPKNEVENTNPAKGEHSSFFVPLEATVTWEINGKEESTEIEGEIKSEDLR
ncbi:type II secretion system protein [Cytobacillus oceanisediminis]|uniref:type IV pilus modification PilV family protein n=1 Tax=Cytobacillus oceanisediminis TaxID=665099 RepID=UPI001D13A61B|nr:type II secretion system protein [Cytobacillus oceanisediminis]MCC3647491.1 type II secretion system protein [Cytobacillus oceanisediminis]